jgi:hypothetical protein
MTPGRRRLRIRLRIGRPHLHLPRVGWRATSSEYTVTALFPPRVRQIDLRYDYPRSPGCRRATTRTGATSTGPRERACACGSTPTSRSIEGQTRAGRRPGRAPRGIGRRSPARSGSRAEGRRRLPRAAGRRGRPAIRRRQTEYYIRLMDDRRPMSASCGRRPTSRSRRSKRSPSRRAPTTTTGSPASSWCSRSAAGTSGPCRSSARPAPMCRRSARRSWPPRNSA